MSKDNPLNLSIITNDISTSIEKAQEKKLKYAYPDSEYTVSLNHKVECLFSIFIKKFMPGHKFNGEKHDFWEMVYIMDGSLSVTEGGTVYDMKKNDIIFHKPNEFHSFNVPQNSNCTIMVLCFSINSDLIEELGNGIYKLSDELHDMLINCYNYISDGFMIDFTYIRKKSFDYNRIAEAIAILSLEKFILTVLLKAKKRTRLNDSTSAENYKRIIEVLSVHIREHLTIEDIAKYCYMTESNVQKTFNKYSGCGIIQYFNSLKITRAKELLKQGYTVDFISKHLGYSSPSYFSRAFKKEMGISPQKYKQSL